jgi:hypothetical protein
MHSAPWFVGMWCVGAGLLAPPVVASETGSCIVLNASTMAAFRLAQAEPGAQTKPKPALAPSRELRQPMTDRELTRLIGFLATSEVDEKQPRSRPSERLTLRRERMGVLLLDSSAILARASLEEALTQLRQSPQPDKIQIEWAENALRGLDMCLQDRYAEFGGDVAFQQAQKLVLGNRKTLEQLITRTALGSRKP